MRTAIATYLGIVLVSSCVSFFVYWCDKQRAAAGERRVPENTLHLLALFGGWPGAYLAQRQFRHKTKKLSFRLAFWVVVALHVGIVGAAFYAAARWS